MNKIKESRIKIAEKNLNQIGYFILASSIVAGIQILIFNNTKYPVDFARTGLFFGFVYLVCSVFIGIKIISAGRNLSSSEIEAGSQGRTDQELPELSGINSFIEEDDKRIRGSAENSEYAGWAGATYSEVDFTVSNYSDLRIPNKDEQLVMYELLVG